MKSNHRTRTVFELVVDIAREVFLLGTIFMSVPLHGSAQASRPPDDSEKAPVPKGKETVDALVTVVAMSRDPWDGPGVGDPFEILLLKVDKLDETKIGPYVRADLFEIAQRTDSEESRIYRQLLSLLRDTRTWKIHLKPPSLSVHCWRIPPPPIPGDLMSSRNPVIVPVGGASGYPDVNSIPCYLVDQRDIQEVPSPQKPNLENRK
jgi:hypothetical protein